MHTDLETIGFKELKEMNDSQAVILSSTTCNKDDIDGFKDYMSEFIPNIETVKEVSGNIKGDDGRCDLAIILNPGEKALSPIDKIRIGATWVSDFTVNYSEDYE